MPLIGLGTSFSDMISNVRSGLTSVTPGSTVLNIVNFEISNVVGPSIFSASTNTTCARSSGVRSSEPKGQPEPTSRSQVMPIFFASSNVTFSASIHSSLSQRSDFLPRSSPVVGNHPQREPYGTSQHQ